MAVHDNRLFFLISKEYTKTFNYSGQQIFIFLR